ncbi:hypothetical protein SEA_NICEHOUSE_208 [Rhodococcus phage NiceHouse]|nr:hypothetical protein SEA_NICEHOUSE_208 [Rhodococcus phage NiceHouse]
MHGLEVVDGKVSFATRRVPAWHGLGTVFTEDLDTTQIMKTAHLNDWNIRQISYKSLMPDTWSTHVDKSMIIRDNPFYDAEIASLDRPGYTQKPINMLGDGSDDYCIMQNEELFEFGALFGQRWETAGSIKNGTVVFGTLALETEIVIDPSGANDVIKQYLMLSTSHNGKLALVVGVTPVRVVCQNTLLVAVGNLKSQIKLRHTKTMSERLNAAKTTAEFAIKYGENFKSESVKLFETPVDDNKFWSIVNEVYKKPSDEDKNKANLTKWTNKTDELMGLWRGKTQENIAGTGWAAVNAFTENQQWNRKVYNRAGSLENFFSAGSGLDDATNKERDDLFQKVSGLVYA